MSDVEFPAPSGIDYELDDLLPANTPERMKALADPLRTMICDLVLQRSMSVTELADEVGRPRSSVAHHVQVLVDAGLVKVVRTRRVRAMTERFYGRTARTFVLSFENGELPFLRDVQREYPVEPPPEPHTNRAGYATFRHARISARRFEKYVERLDALSLEFSAEPRPANDSHSPAEEFAIYLLAFPSTRCQAIHQSSSSDSGGEVDDKCGSDS